MATGTIFTDTKRLKVVALCIAVSTTFWFFIRLNQDHNATIKYPIEFLFDSEQYIVTEELPEVVEINVRGGGWEILRKGYLFNADPVLYQLENPERPQRLPRESLFEPISERISGLGLNYILNDTLFLNIEKVESKSVLLVVDSLGLNLSTNYHLVSPIVTNLDSAKITGPRSFIQDYPDTLWVRIEDRIDEDFNESVTLDSYVELVNPEPSEVIVQFDVQRFVEMNQTVPVTAVNFPADSSAFLADTTLSLSFWIAENRVESFKPTEFTIEADLEKMVSFDSSIQAIITKYPADIRRLSMDRSRTKVFYRSQQ